MGYAMNWESNLKIAFFVIATILFSDTLSNGQPCKSVSTKNGSTNVCEGDKDLTWAYCLQNVSSSAPDKSFAILFYSMEHCLEQCELNDQCVGVLLTTVGFE